jgi:hypothetical protein
MKLLPQFRTEFETPRFRMDSVGVRTGVEKKWYEANVVAKGSFMN